MFVSYKATPAHVPRPDDMWEDDCRDRTEAVLCEGTHYATCVVHSLGQQDEPCIKTSLEHDISGEIWSRDVSTKMLGHATPPT